MFLPRVSRGGAALLVFTCLFDDGCVFRYDEGGCLPPIAHCRVSAKET